MDECAKFPGQLCDHICLNTPGSYRCACHDGFFLKSDERTCEQAVKGQIISIYLFFWTKERKFVVTHCEIGHWKKQRGYCHSLILLSEKVLHCRKTLNKASILSPVTICALHYIFLTSKHKYIKNLNHRCCFKIKCFTSLVIWLLVQGNSCKFFDAG